MEWDPYVYLLFSLSQEEAYEESQKYKVGKIIIEKAMMTKDNGTWEE